MQNHSETVIEESRYLASAIVKSKIDEMLDKFGHVQVAVHKAGIINGKQYYRVVINAH